MGNKGNIMNNNIEKDIINHEHDVINNTLTEEIENTKSKLKSINTTTIIIFFLLIFLISSILVLQISIKSSEAVNFNKENSKLRIASSYINIVIKQNDVADKIKPLSDINAKYNGILIKDYADIENLKLAVFHKDGAIYESLFEDEFDPTLSEKIIDIEDFDVTIEDDLLCVIITNKNKSIIRYISFRAGGK